MNNNYDIQSARDIDTDELTYHPYIQRNINNKLLTIITFIFTITALSPLIFVLFFIFYKGISQLDLSLFLTLPNAPGSELAGGIGNAMLGTIIVTFVAGLIAVPVGIGGGIYLAEYSREGTFSNFIRFGTNVLAGVPSIIAGVFVYGVIVSTGIIMGSRFSAIAGSMALSILMLPSIIKTTDEGLKLVSDELRKGSLSLGASKLTTIIKITLPAAILPIGTGVLLGIARAAGETAPLIFTALFSYYWPSSSSLLTEPIATLSVLIYNFSIEPYEIQNQLAWAASLVLVIMILFMNIIARWFSHITAK